MLEQAQLGTAQNEIKRRRTFAIISHPDAGKTTITEKFLLYGGAVNLAGTVTARKNQRATTSDWLELEKKRGISVSSTVLQFDYEGYRVNLLDTPGHQDFSDDTYRVLRAVDAAIMVIDGGKGIESRTQKLFEVCRDRGVPIFTFINKMDRPSREPLELLDQIEEVLGIAAYPVNWPLGTGNLFKGVWDRSTRTAHLFERTPGGSYRAPVKLGDLSDPLIKDSMDELTYNTVCEEVEILEMAGAAFDPEAVLAGKTTPVYFGSALNNFGVQLLLDGFLKHSSPPMPRESIDGRMIAPASPPFSGFVFKIQTNMDPQHRDRVAFIRIVSGKFERNMNVLHAQTGKSVRVSNASKIFGSERETIEEAYAGDVVGIVGNDLFAIGDTLTEDASIVYDEIPYFAPECFTTITSPIPAQHKRFRTGLKQLLREGVVQEYEMRETGGATLLLGAAGPLQFEVVQYRLESEYGADSRLGPAPWTGAQWIEVEDTDSLFMSLGVRLAFDGMGRQVLLYKDTWSLKYFTDKNPNVHLSHRPIGHGQVASRKD